MYKGTTVTFFVYKLLELMMYSWHTKGSFGMTSMGLKNDFECIKINFIVR